MVTQTAIHILNGEFSLATAKAAINNADPEAALAKNSGLSVLLKGVKSPSAATKTRSLLQLNILSTEQTTAPIIPVGTATDGLS